MKRYAAQRDVNEEPIVVALKDHPQVRLVHRMDQPCDLLIQLTDGSWHLLEVKNREHGNRRRLTKAQKLFWKRALPAPPLVTSPSEALASLGLDERIS